MSFEIYRADPDPVGGSEQAGLRPVVILGSDLFNGRPGTVIAMPINSRPQAAGFALNAELPITQQLLLSARPNRPHQHAAFSGCDSNGERSVRFEVGWRVSIAVASYWAERTVRWDSAVQEIV